MMSGIKSLACGAFALLLVLTGTSDWAFIALSEGFSCPDARFARQATRFDKVVSTTNSLSKRPNR
jgi:hypothetical protein